MKKVVDMLSSKKAIRILFLCFADALAITCCQFLSLMLRFEFQIAMLKDSGFLENITVFLPASIAVGLLIFALLGLYQSLWSYAGIEESMHIFCAVAIFSGLQYALMQIARLSIPRSFPFINGMVLLLMVGGIRFSYRMIREVMDNGIRRKKNQIRTMLIGAGAAGTMALNDLNRSARSGNRVVCIIDDDLRKVGMTLRGVPVVGTREVICQMAEKYRVEEIILAIPTASPDQKRKILNICQETGCQTKTIPSLAEIASGRVELTQIRKVEIEDLLGRDSVKVNLDEIAGYIEGKTVLVTGGGGSIGSELCRQIADHQPKKLIIFDIYENNAYAIQQEIRRSHEELDLEVLIGSVRDEDRVESIFRTYHPEIVYHAAAHKHVPLMEDSPNEAVKNNVIGTYHVAAAAARNHAEIFVQISTDKAVNPTNVMGATKRLCEMIVQMFSQRSETKFVAVRFGNVLGSSGSVIPLFKKQIERGGPVTVTHKDIIRYFMTIPEAVSLVMQAGAYAKGGEIFVLDMGVPVRIDDLARKMIRLSGYTPDVDMEIKYIGLRPGEKLFEELLMNEEGMRTTENKLIFIGRPLEINEAEFMVQLRELKELAEANSEEIKERLEQIVPTYQITPNKPESAVS